MKKFQIYMILESTENDGETWDDTDEHAAVPVYLDDTGGTPGMGFAALSMLLGRARQMAEEDGDDQEEG